MHCFAEPGEMPGSWVLWQLQYAVMQGCVRLRNALKCTEMHLRGCVYSQVEPLTSKAAE